MESIYSSPLVSTALRHFGKRNAMPTKSSRLVPFEMQNYCYEDELGRESLAVMRSLNYTSGAQGLNSLLVDGREGLVDYFGDGPELLWPLDASDGFILVPHITPGGLDEFADTVVPLLQERGVYRTEYEGDTLRDHLGLPTPTNPR